MHGLRLPPVLAAVLASCAAEPPAPSPSPSAQSAPPSASEAPSPTSSPTALGRPPACIGAKLLWADALERLILANCVDQFDLTSLVGVIRGRKDQSPSRCPGEDGGVMRAFHRE